MVQRMQPDPSSAVASQGEAAGSGDDLEVEPVATLAGDTSRIADMPPEARVERLRRVALELQVTALEAELERARRRQDLVIEQYENVLARQSDEDDSHPVFSWLDPR